MKIAMQRIVKKYGEKTVLNIDKLLLKEGLITGIIGPNGSGKSTLMKIIAGLDGDYSGEIKIGERLCTQETSKNITLVFQKPYLMNTDVYNNIAYPLKLRNIAKTEIKEKVDEMIELLQLKAIIEQNAKTLSGGEGQKVALARAIVFRPKLLLLDEPTANIDPQTMQLMENAIKYINQSSNTTVVMVTHNIRQLQRMCREAVYMQEGNIVEQGLTEEVLCNIRGTYKEELLD